MFGIENLDIRSYIICADVRRKVNDSEPVRSHIFDLDLHVSSTVEINSDKNSARLSSEKR